MVDVEVNVQMNHQETPMIVVGLRRDEDGSECHIRVLLNHTLMRRCEATEVKELADYMDSDEFEYHEDKDDVYIFSSIEWTDYEEFEDLKDWTFEELVSSSLILPELDGAQLFLWEVDRTMKSAELTKSKIMSLFMDEELIIAIGLDGSLQILKDEIEVNDAE